MPQTIIFTDRTPEAYMTFAGVQGENGVTILNFVLPTDTADGVHLADFTPSLKASYPDGTSDSIVLPVVTPTSDVAQSGTSWTVLGRSTNVAGNITCTLEFYDSTDNRVWNTEQFILQVNPAIMADVAIANTYPTQLQQMQAEILAVEQGEYSAGTTESASVAISSANEITVTVQDSPQLGGQPPSYYARNNQIPTQVSQLANDAEYITASEVAPVTAGSGISVIDNTVTNTDPGSTAVTAHDTEYNHAEIAETAAALTAHEAGTGTEVHGLGTASTHAASDFDAAGTAEIVVAGVTPLSIGAVSGTLLGHPGGVATTDTNNRLVQDIPAANVLGLSPVATSGSYNSLTNLPSGTMNWRNPWVSGTSYAVNDVVTYQNSICICSEAIASSTTNPLSDNIHFLPVLNAAEWFGAWTYGQSYGVGSLVTYGGSLYACTTAIVASVTYPSADSAHFALMIQGSSGIQFSNISGTLVAAQMPTNDRIRNLSFTFGNGTAVLSAQFLGGMGIGYAGTLVGVTLIACDSLTATAGSCSADILRHNAGSIISTDSIVGSGTKPSLSTATYSQVTSFAGWTSTTFAANDVLGINLLTPTLLKQLTVVLAIEVS